LLMLSERDRSSIPAWDEDDLRASAWRFSSQHQRLMPHWSDRGIVSWPSGNRAARLADEVDPGWWHGRCDARWSIGEQVTGYSFPSIAAGDVVIVPGWRSAHVGVVTAPVVEDRSETDLRSGVQCEVVWVGKTVRHRAGSDVAKVLRAHR